MSKGRLLVIEGLDGSGKATQAKLLASHLAESGCKVMEITFPDYESDSSALVKMYLSGQFGDKPDDVNPYAASSFYAVDRYASYKTKWGSFYEAGGIVIADRYTTSNAVHQCSKLPPEQWDDFLRWAFDYEYRLLGLPAPDAVFIGGSKGSLAAIVDAALDKNPDARICVSAIALESLSAAVAALTAKGRTVQVSQIAVSRARAVGGLHLMMAQNPIYLITGE
jgi:hypothetical protein